MCPVNGALRRIAATLMAIASFTLPVVEASGRERLLVLMTIDRENETEWPPWAQTPDVEGELTELAVAATAIETAYEPVGIRELRQKMGSTFPTALDACTRRPACLATLARNASSTRVAIGQVKRWRGGLALRLALIHPETGAALHEWLSSPVKDLPQLNSALRQGFRALFLPPVLSPRDPEAVPRAAPPAAHLPLTASSASNGPQAVAYPRPPNEHSTFLPALGYASLALAAVAFSAAIVTGSLGEAAPSGSTRAEAQNDLGRRKDYTNTANQLLIAGSLSAVAGVGAFGWLYWKTHWRSP